MLIIAPPSETKARTPEQGPAVDLAELSFPELSPMRRRVIDALIETSGRNDAFERLRARPSALHDIAMNTHVLDLPARAAHEVYTGPLHQGLDIAALGAAADRAEREVVIVSALWGALRPSDRIPRYRLLIYADVAGVERLDRAWRRHIPGVLAAAAGPEGVILDLRAPTYQAMGMATASAHRTATVRIDHELPGHRVPEVIVKRTRGAAAHHLLESGVEPRDLDELAEVLGDRWPVRLETPTRRDGPWSITLSVST